MSVRFYGRKPLSFDWLPGETGMFYVYVYEKGGDVQYVGQTTNLRARVNDHWGKVMRPGPSSFLTTYGCRTRKAAERMEASLIWALKPPLNKHYPAHRGRQSMVRTKTGEMVPWTPPPGRGGRHEDPAGLDLMGLWMEIEREIERNAS